MHSYLISGQAVGSEIELAGMIPGPQDRVPDVTIRRGAVPERLDNAQAEGPTWSFAGGDMVLRVPDIVRFRLAGSREIVCQTEGGSDTDIAAFIVGAALGTLLQLRGEIVLHASAVRVNGKAALFCGPSGAGKSTLAAALTQRGYAMLADDICVLTQAADGSAMVHPDGRTLKLWSRSIDGLKLAERQGPKIREKLEKHFVEPPASVHGALPLGAVYALREIRPPLTSGIERLNVVDAALLLRRSAYRPLLINIMQQRPLYLRAVTIGNHAGIHQLTRAMDFASLPEVARWLEQHWRELGVMQRAA